MANLIHGLIFKIQLVYQDAVEVVLVDAEDASDAVSAAIKSVADRPDYDGTSIRTISTALIDTSI